MAGKITKTRAKRILKWASLTILSILLFIFIAIGIVVNFIFTSSKLTPIVERMADDYLKADVHIGAIELTFFSTFPDFGLKIKDATVISGVFRDTISLPAAVDSLMHVEECLITVDPVAYLKKGRIKVKDFVLERPQIYAYVDTLGVANWNILKLPADTAVQAEVVDTTTATSPLRLDIKNVRIRDGRLIFDDRSTELYTRIDGLGLSVDGKLGGHRAKMKLDLTTKNILFWQHGQLLVKKMSLGIESDMKVNRDSLKYTLDKAVFDVNGVKFGAGGTIRADSANRTLDVDIKYGIHIPSLESLLNMIPDTILQKGKNADIRGNVLCTGTIKGIYGKKRVPQITATFKITDGYIAYEGMPSKIDTLSTDFDAFIDLEKNQSSYIKLNRFCLKSGETDIDIEGQVKNLLTDPLIQAKIEGVVNFDDITRIFPLADGITCRGKLEASLKTDILLSDVTTANYGRLKVGGWCKMKNIAVFIPKDSIVMNVKSAGLGFATNRKDKNVYQGVDLLNGIVGYSGLDINVKSRIRLKMDTTYLTLKTSPLKDTTSIATVTSSLHLGKTVIIVRDTLLLGLKKADVKAKLKPSERNKQIPRIEADMQIDSLRIRSLGNRLNLAKTDIHLTGTRSRRDERIWRVLGYMDFEGLRAYTPYFPLRIRMPGTRIQFDRNEIRLDSARVKLGQSDIRLTGSVKNLTRSFFMKEDIDAELYVQSKMINCNQLMKALDEGTAYMNRVGKGYIDIINTEDDDMDQMAVVSDTVGYEGATSVFVVPRGINLNFRMDLNRVIFGQLTMDSIHGEMNMKNQCIEISDMSLHSAAADMNATAVYKATDTLRAYTGFALKMHDIRVDSLVRVIPSLDTLFPMLRSFEGEVDFHISAEAWLDSTMMIELPTLRAAAYLDGHDLVLMDGETFAEISKMLMFKNKKRNIIDSVSVDLMVKDGIVEIFPFMLEVDRYKVAIGGEHKVDMSFKYHISILKSPLPFRAGVDISGTLDKMKYRITKAKYKDLFIPSRKAKVDSTQLNLQKKIRDMLRAGR